jgi:hypothetical protein
MMSLRDFLLFNNMSIDGVVFSYGITAASEI